MAMTIKGAEILAYLKEHGAIYTDMIAVLKSHGKGGNRNISNTYINARILNETLPGYPEQHVHADFLTDIGALIGDYAEAMGATMICRHRYHWCNLGELCRRCLWHHRLLHQPTRRKSRPRR